MVVGLFGYRFLLGESECNLNFWGFYDVTVSAYGLIFFIVFWRWKVNVI